MQGNGAEPFAAFQTARLRLHCVRAQDATALAALMITRPRAAAGAPA
jgi:hypothetical protein